jgi:hypothetical protein
MGHIRTSAISYWRGVPKNLHGYGQLALANYPIVQPQQIILTALNNNKSQIRTRINNYRNNYMNIPILNSRFF